jgi:hypothetical protein
VPVQPARGVEAGQFRDVRVAGGGAVLVEAVDPRGLGQLADRGLVGGGDRPADGERHAAPHPVHLFEVLEQFVGGAGAIDADQQLAPVGDRELGDRVPEDPEVVNDRVRSGVAGSQQHGQTLRGVGAPGAQRMKPETLLEGGGRALLGAMGGEQRGVQIDDYPSGQQLAGHAQPREALRPAGKKRPHVSADLRPRFADPFQCLLVEAGQRSPDGRLRRPITEDQALMSEKADVGNARGAEHDRDGQTDQDRAAIPPARALTTRQHLVQPAGQTHPVRAFTQQHRTRVADQALPTRADDQPLIPSTTFTHQKGAPCSATDMT